MVAPQLTLADLAVWGALKLFGEVDPKLPHLARWFNFLDGQGAFRTVGGLLRSKMLARPSPSPAGTPSPAPGKKTPTPATAANALTAAPKMPRPPIVTPLGREIPLIPISPDLAFDPAKMGQFDIDLPGAEEGWVCTRFPPEPSGYLHIGHFKAAFLNQFYATRYKGRMIMRFDDTNPAKENAEFHQAIWEDMQTLRIVPSIVTHTSDYFDVFLRYCEQLLRAGKGYVDNTPQAQMQEERGAGIESRCRNQDVETNMRLWAMMQEGSEEGQKYCVRAKIDMQATNKALRDPVMYRVSLIPHPITKTKYKVYPSYDFACPIIDSIEGVTHALRTTEYHDRNEQYHWVQDALGLRRVCIYDFSRLNFVKSVMSKRRLKWFVDQGLVEGWDDPRFPTIRGMARRGLTIEALRLFIFEQGASKAINLQTWDKLWSINKKVIDPVAPRYTALTKAAAVPMEIADGPAEAEYRTVPKHRKNPTVGNKVVRYARRILLEQEDAALCQAGTEITLMNWGNCVVDEVVREGEAVVRMRGHLHLEGNPKDTQLKLTWLAEAEDLLPVKAVTFGHLITKDKIEEDEKFEDFVNHHSKEEVELLGDPSLRSLKKGDIIQLERKGFYFCDRAYTREQRPLVLHYIPDGHIEKEDKKAAAAK
eukprot:GAFH01000930.1.p1 GENE.GAFH01000930.1~~GAFH01000930.1.p1  ORF type:complete len:759 (-),score=330.82 GAFH01000930.1:57-2000(-)